MDQSDETRPDGPKSHTREAERSDLSLSAADTSVTGSDATSSASEDQRIVLDDVIDASEAARRLGVKREHVVKLLQRGQLPGKRLTATWVTTRQAIDAYARRRRPRGRPRSRPI